MDPLGVATCVVISVPLVASVESASAQSRTSTKLIKPTTQALHRC